MDLFSVISLQKLKKEDEKLRKFTESKYSLEIISSADPNTHFEKLLNIKYLFQKMLPKMPKEYILRQVFDKKHSSLILKSGDDNDSFIGAACFRPAFEKGFLELVFFAIDSEFHIMGFGSFLFNCFKEVGKMQYKLYQMIGESCNAKNLCFSDLSIFEKNKSTESLPIIVDNVLKYISKDDTNFYNLYDQLIQKKERFKPHLYILTYADNSAIGFFKKQGFTTRPVSSEWMNYIKDYDGGALMECRLYSEINYLNSREPVEIVRNKIFEEMKKINEFHIIRDPHDVGFSNQVFELTEKIGMPERRPEDFLKDFISFLICDLQSNPSAWPFLEPVNAKDVPDYLTVIKTPIDLGTMQKKHSLNVYNNLKDFSDDIYLMVNNCYAYNGIETQYYKCAEIIQNSYEDLMEKYKEVIRSWGYDF